MTDKTVKVYIGKSMPPVVIDCAQYDTEWRWHFQVFYNDERWTIPTGSTIILTGKKPDGHVFAYQGTLTNNEAVVDCETQMTACAGLVATELRILKSGRSVATSRMFLAVKTSPEGEDDVASETALTAYAELFGELDALIEEVQKYPEKWGAPLVASTVAGMTDTSRVYVYTGSETGYTSGNWYYWDGSAWTSGGIYNSEALETDKTLTISGAAADGAATGENVKAIVNSIAGKPLVFESGYYNIRARGTLVNITTRLAASNVVSAVSECSPGDVLYLHVVGGGINTGGARAYGFLDAEQKVLTRAGVNTELLGWEINAPSDAAYVVVNALNIKDGAPLDYYASIGVPTSKRLDTIQAYQIFSHRQKVLMSRLFDTLAFADIAKGEDLLTEFRAVLAYKEIDTSSAWSVGRYIGTVDGETMVGAYSAATVSGNWYYETDGGTVIWYDGELYDADGDAFAVTLHEYNDDGTWVKASSLVTTKNNQRVRNPVKTRPATKKVRFDLRYIDTSLTMTDDTVGKCFAASEETEVL